MEPVATSPDKFIPVPVEHVAGVPISRWEPPTLATPNVRSPIAASMPSPRGRMLGITANTAAAFGGLGMMTRTLDTGVDAAFTPVVRSRSATPPPAAAPPGEPMPWGWESQIGGSRQYRFAQPPRTYNPMPPAELARTATVSPPLPVTCTISVTPPIPLSPPRPPSPPRSYVRAVSPPMPRAPTLLHTTTVVHSTRLDASPGPSRRANPVAPCFPRPIPIAFVATPGHRAHREVHPTAARPAMGQARGQELTMHNGVVEGNDASATGSHTRPVAAEPPFSIEAATELDTFRAESDAIANGWNPSAAEASAFGAPGGMMWPREPIATAPVVASNQASNVKTPERSSPKSMLRLAVQAQWPDGNGTLSPLATTTQTEHKDDTHDSQYGCTSLQPRSPRSQSTAPTLAFAAASSNSRTLGDSGSIGTGGSAASNDWQHQGLSERLLDPVAATLEQLRTHFDETKQQVARQDEGETVTGVHLDGGLMLSPDSSLMLSPDTSQLWISTNQSPCCGTLCATEGGRAPTNAGKHDEGTSSGEECNVDGADADVPLGEALLHLDNQIGILEEILTRVEQNNW